MQKSVLKALILTLFFSLVTQAQEISSKVLDSVSKEPIPFATIIFKNRGTVTNEEGKFTFNIGKKSQISDTLKISCIGYETLAKPLNQFTEEAIYLSPKTNELKEIILTNKDYSAEEIIDKVKDNIENNYNFNYSKKRLFFRESTHQSKIKNNYTLKKSTIPELNKQFLDSVINSIPEQNSYYTEILCDLYGNYKKENQKIELIKASELYNKDNEVGLTALQNKFNDIINKNVKKDSYFKVKSGIIGQKVKFEDLLGDDLDSTGVAEVKDAVKKQQEKENKRKKSFTQGRKDGLSFMIENLFFQKETDLSFIRRPNRYYYELKELTYLGEDAVYVINFTPGMFTSYKGTLYISISDFALLRADYHNTEPTKTFKMFGINYNAYLNKGKMIFSKGNDGKYALKYLENENASSFGLKRPFKIIEKNKNVKGKRKQNELSLKLDMAFGHRNKKEIIFFDTENITTTHFNGLKEKSNILPTYMPSYNPDFWKGHNIIEPNKAIRDFTAIEQ